MVVVVGNVKIVRPTIKSIQTQQPPIPSEKAQSASKPLPKKRGRPLEPKKRGRPPTPQKCGRPPKRNNVEHASLAADIPATTDLNATIATQNPLNPSPSENRPMHGYHPAFHARPAANEFVDPFFLLPPPPPPVPPPMTNPYYRSYVVNYWKRFQWHTHDDGTLTRGKGIKTFSPIVVDGQMGVGRKGRKIYHPPAVAGFQIGTWVRAMREVGNEVDENEDIVEYEKKEEGGVTGAEESDDKRSD